MSVRSGTVVVKDFDKLVSMAQYKNTHHHGVGYFSDTAIAKQELRSGPRISDSGISEV
jgi:hypothetical protein